MTLEKAILSFKSSAFLEIVVKSNLLGKKFDKKEIKFFLTTYLLHIEIKIKLGKVSNWNSYTIYKSKNFFLWYVFFLNKDHAKEEQMKIDLSLMRHQKKKTEIIWRITTLGWIYVFFAFLIGFFSAFIVFKEMLHTPESSRNRLRKGSDVIGIYRHIDISFG